MSTNYPDTHLFLNGEWREAVAKERLEIINPAPEEVIGKKVSVLLNLAPRKIRGVESQGMILMAESEEGELSFVAPTKEINPGNIIR